jgi:hypothetical protein
MEDDGIFMDTFRCFLLFDSFLDFQGKVAEQLSRGFSTENVCMYVFAECKHTLL